MNDIQNVPQEYFPNDLPTEEEIEDMVMELDKRTGTVMESEVK